MEYWYLCRKMVGCFASQVDPLFPSYESLHSRGCSIDIPEVNQILADDLLGGWALDAQTIRLLWNYLWDQTPQTVVEYGSGVSTILLAVYASLFGVQTGKLCQVISLEADQIHKNSVLQRLKTNNLNAVSKIINLHRNGDGKYDFRALDCILAGSLIDLVLIDGPSGSPGCRGDTLPAVLDYCKSGSRWFLDDAFRDGELEFLRAWRHVPRIEVEGIFPVGKGLAAGRVT
jgi:hypothetical protein